LACRGGFGSRNLSSGRLDQRDNSLNGNGLAFFDADFLEHTGRRRGYLSVDFIGRNLEKRFIAIDGIARLFQPLGNGSFEDAFAHLGHDYFDGHSPLLSSFLRQFPRSLPAAKQAH
jgi:hypothetical protein